MYVYLTKQTVRTSDHMATPNWIPLLSSASMQPMIENPSNEASSTAQPLCYQGCYNPGSYLQALKYGEHCKCIRGV